MISQYIYGAISALMASGRELSWQRCVRKVSKVIQSRRSSPDSLQKHHSQDLESQVENAAGLLFPQIFNEANGPRNSLRHEFQRENVHGTAPTRLVNCLSTAFFQIVAKQMFRRADSLELRTATLNSEC